MTLSPHMNFDEQRQLSADNTLTDAVILKYQNAAAFANDAIKAVIMAAKPGVLVSELCRIGDEFIMSQTSKVFSRGNVERGIAFPTTIGVNEIAMNYTPLDADSIALAEGDVIKICLGVQIDGYVATLAHTVILNPTPATPIQGKQADVVCAAYYAAELAARIVRDGGTSTEIIDGINRVAASFGVKPVVGTSTHLMKRFLPESMQEIPNGIDSSDHGDGFVFGTNDVFCIDVMMTSGPGALKATTDRANVTQRDIELNPRFKVKASWNAFNDAVKTFGVFPFSQRALIDMNPQHRLGIPECLKGAFISRPVLAIPHGECLAHFRMTVLLLQSGPMRLTAPLSPPYVHSEYSIEGTDLERKIKGDIKIAKAKNPLSAQSKMDTA